MKVHTLHADGPFFQTFAYLYEILATRPFPRILGADDQSSLFPTKPFVLGHLGPLVKAIYKAVGQPGPDAIYVDTISALPIKFSYDRVVVAFSGGKDSIAQALKLWHKGLNPTLFFVSGINKSYRSELEYARRAADVLKMPLHVEEISIHGKTDFVENPIKNFLILAMMVEWGRQCGIMRYALGSDAHLGSTVNPEYDLSDSVELLAMAGDFYRHYMPHFDIITEVQSATDAFYTIWKRAAHILRLKDYLSCILPEFRKPNVQAANIRKGIVLQAARCGSCNKCAKEYLHDVIFGFQPFNKEYAERCVVNIAKRDYQENVQVETFFDYEAVDVPFLQTNVPSWADFDPKKENFIAALERRAGKV